MKMEKNCALRPPSRIRGMSMWPSASRLPRSNVPVSIRCGVSACVSRTIEEKCSLCARSAISSAEVRRAKKSPAHRQVLRHKPARTRRMHFPQAADSGESLPYKPAEKRLFPRFAVYFRDGLGQGNALGASTNAVLRVGAFLYAARTHESRKALAFIHRSRGVHVEQAHLADNGCAHELIMLIHLRANLQAVPASDAVRERIALLLDLDRKSTRLNSSHSQISYAVFCLKKKNKPPTHKEGRGIRGATPDHPWSVRPPAGADPPGHRRLRARGRPPPRDRRAGGGRAYRRD